MASSKAKQNPTLSILPALFIIAYLCIGFVPNWGAVDKIAPQWLVLTLLNGLSALFVLYHRKAFASALQLTLQSKMVLSYSLFFVWAALSYFYAINPTEVLVNLPRHLNTALMLFFIGIFIYGIKNRNRFFAWVITMILGIEVYAVFQEAFTMIETSGAVNSGVLKGVTANRNITAFSIAIKVPFLLYLVCQPNKKIIQVAFLVLLTFSMLAISIIQSRASYVAAGVTLVSFLMLCVYFFKQTQEKRWLWNGAYFVTPLVLALLINSTYFSNKGANALDRASTISLSTNDGSVNQRLRYYADVLEQMIASPMLGVGIGNWKIKSIEYDKNDIRGYVVPYHAHSDFIQLGAELGIIGFLFYLSVFVFAAWYVLQLFRSSKITTDQKLFVLLLFTGLLVYSVDANLNFPIARPQVLAPWALLMAMINYYYQLQRQTPEQAPMPTYQKIAIKGFPMISLLLLLPAGKITHTTFKSLQSQMIILQDFNSNKYSIPLNQIENFIEPLPNITVTTIPMDAIKARYYFHYKKYDQALAYAEKGKTANPYLMYPEVLQSQIFEVQGDLENAFINAKKAFYNLPNNSLHSSRFINLAIRLRKGDELVEAFELLTLKNNNNNWKNYLIGVSQIFEPGIPELIEHAKEAKNLFPSDPQFLQLYKIISIGQERISKGINFSNEALSFFNKGDHENAVNFFEKAIESDPIEYSYYENAATSYYLINDLNKSLEYINKVVNEMNPLNGKCEYIKALIFIRMGDPVGACPLLLTAKDSGYAQAEATYQQYCPQ
ncbi:MAG: O-antigen ligase family protein [Flavobacteriaceae bacterium]